MNGLSLMLIESVINQIIESVLHNGKTTEKEHADAYIRSEEETATTERQELTDQALDAERDIMYAIENLNIALDDEEVYEYCF
jgi:hypothetical protein